MLFSDRPRTLYRNRPAHEVICQLRFPSILSINQVEPAEFQEDIRDAFPQYARRQDLPPIVGGQTPPPPVTNYHFLSEDGRWKLNLTKDFIIYFPGQTELAVTISTSEVFTIWSAAYMPLAMLPNSIIPIAFAILIPPDYHNSVFNRRYGSVNACVTGSA